MCKFTNLVNEMLKLAKKPQQNWFFFIRLQNYQLSQIRNSLKNYFAFEILFKYL